MIILDPGSGLVVWKFLYVFKIFVASWMWLWKNWKLFLAILWDSEECKHGIFYAIVSVLTLRSKLSGWILLSDINTLHNVKKFNYHNYHLTYINEFLCCEF